MENQSTEKMTIGPKLKKNARLKNEEYCLEPNFLPHFHLVNFEALITHHHTKSYPTMTYIEDIIILPIIYIYFIWGFFWGGGFSVL